MASLGRRLFLCSAALLAVGAAWRLAPRSPVVEVSPRTPISRLLEAMPAGAVVRLMPGQHGPFVVRRTVTVEGSPGSVVRGPVKVLADGVALIGLRVVGGESGVSVEGADEVVLERVAVRGAALHGIEIAEGSAKIHGCVVAGLRSPYGQGVEIRNSNGHPRTVVEGCSVSSGQEGLVSHVSRVEFRGNLVTGSTLRGIAVTEMSEGLVEGNDIRGVGGAGLYCGDMSHCELRHNRVNGVGAHPSGVRSAGGYGAVAWFHSTMRLKDNSFSGLASREDVGLYAGGAVTDRFPLSIWPPGWRGAIPGVLVTLISLLALMTVRCAVGPFVARIRESRPDDDRGGGPVTGNLMALLFLGFLIASFHMLEHVVQVYQVYVAQTEGHSGLLGALLDTEWVHFIYNAAVLSFLLWMWRVVSRSASGAWSHAAATYVLAALLLQGYHMVEHTAKIAQHLASGLDPAPGLLGGVVGLVWFHFGINLAVYAGMTIPMLSLLHGRGRVISLLPHPPFAARARLPA